MKSLWLVAMLMLFFLPLVNATQHIEFLSFDNSSFNATCYRISTNTSTPTAFTIPCSANDDLRIAFKSPLTDAKFDIWNAVNVSFISVIGSVATDCTGSIEAKGVNVQPLMLNVSIPELVPKQYAAVCIRTVEGYHAIASNFGFNGTHFNMTLQWNDNGNFYFPYTTVRNPDSFTIPSYYPALPNSQQYANLYDIDNGLNYMLQPMLYPQAIALDRTEYKTTDSFGISRFNVDTLNGWSTRENPFTALGYPTCWDIPQSEYGKFTFGTMQSSNADFPYCIKSSEGQWFYVERKNHETGVPYLQVTRLPYPAFYTQAVRLTDIGNLWIRTSQVIVNTQRFFTRGYSGGISFPYIANGSYDFMFNATDGRAYTGGSHLANPVGKNVTSLAAFDYTDINNLNAFDCSVYEPYLYTIGTDTRSLNPSENRIICFNSSTPNNPELFTAVKFVNTTNVRGGNATEFDVYFGVYNNYAIVFSGFQYFPSAIRIGDTVAFSWNTRFNLTTEMKIQYRNINTGQWSGWITIQGSQNFTKTHSIIANGSSFTQPTEYQAQLVGYDSLGTPYASSVYSFSISEVPFVSEITGLGVCTFGELGYPYPASVSLDGNRHIFTSKYVNSQNITVYCVEFSREAAPLLVPHNISAISYDHKRSANISILMEQYPFFLKLYMNASKGCIPYLFSAQMDFCTDNINATKGVRESIGSTGAYCAYNPDECFLFNISQDYQCISKAGERTPPQSWVLYACFGGYLPEGVSGNVTMPEGYRTIGTSGQNVQNAICVGINSLLNTTCNQSLWFVGLMISLALMGAMAFLTKSGLVGTVTGLISVIAFTGIGWIPIWVGISIAVIASLLIAKFMASSVMPQGQ